MAKVCPCWHERGTPEKGLKLGKLFVFVRFITLAKAKKNKLSESCFILTEPTVILPEDLVQVTPDGAAG